MITEGDVRLRPLEAKDLETCRQWVNDPEVARLVNRVLPVSAVEHAEWHKRLVADRSQVLFAIDVASGRRRRHIGNCGLKSIDQRAQKAELWIYIGEKRCWGKGYGSQATRALLRFAFQSLGLNRVYLYCPAYNERALGMYEKVGFKREGRFRQDIFMDGQYHDSIWMAILKEDYGRARPRKGS